MKIEKGGGREKETSTRQLDSVPWIQVRVDINKNQRWRLGEHQQLCGLCCSRLRSWPCLRVLNFLVVTDR